MKVSAGERQREKNEGSESWTMYLGVGSGPWLEGLIYSLPYSRVNAWLPLIGARIWYIDFDMSFHNMALTFLTL
jgi:hypothetical protein